MFVPCEAGKKSQTFSYGHSYDATHIQLKVGTSQIYCIDAAGGGGPLVYQCHPVDHDSPQQKFNAKAGAALMWERVPGDGQAVTFCVEPMPDLVALTVCAGGDDSAAKAGQGFLKHDVRDDGTFQLIEQGTSEPKCMEPVLHSGQYMLTTETCTGDERQRWSTSKGELKNVALNMCVDSNDLEHPILYTCYPAGTNAKQRFVLHENGWVEIPHSWADNGRVRYLGKCFDARPVDAMPLEAQNCEAVKSIGTTWEKIWQATPLETQLWLDDSGKRGNLRKS
jgi:hypothetical protein